MDIFEQSKRWPMEERFALTDQVRRASRSVCANIAEAWRKRRYPKHFIVKLSDADADAEAAEVQNWLRFAEACGYLDDDTFTTLNDRYHQIIAGLVKMMTTPDQWCGPAHLVRDPLASYDACPD